MATRHEKQMMDKILEHLSNEIQKLMENTMTFRTRVAFIGWIGPFLLLSSVVVSTKGIFTVPCKDKWFWFALAGSAGCYLALGYIGGLIEKQAWVRCDALRQRILRYSKLPSTESIQEDDLNDMFISRSVRCGYMSGFAIVLVSLVGVSIAISRIDVKDQPEGGVPCCCCSVETGNEQ